MCFGEAAALKDSFAGDFGEAVDHDAERLAASV